jgi:hypothetical protein
MSAAATAAGYLYASGRLRGRGAKDQEQQHQEAPPKKEKPRHEVRVAVYQPEEKPKRVPKVEYRTRRTWKPE